MLQISKIQIPKFQITKGGAYARLALTCGLAYIGATFTVLVAQSNHPGFQWAGAWHLITAPIAVIPSLFAAGSGAKVFMSTAWARAHSEPDPALTPEQLNAANLTVIKTDAAALVPALDPDALVKAIVSGLQAPPPPPAPRVPPTPEEALQVISEAVANRTNMTGLGQSDLGQKVPSDNAPPAMQDSARTAIHADDVISGGAVIVSQPVSEAV